MKTIKVPTDRSHFTTLPNLQDVFEFNDADLAANRYKQLTFTQKIVCVAIIVQYL